MRASPPSDLKPSPPRLPRDEVTDCSSIRHSYDSTYDRTVDTTHDSPTRNHKRSTSAPKENICNKYQRSPLEKDSLGNTDTSIGFDTVVSVRSSEKVTKERFVVVEDLKAALFQD